MEESNMHHSFNKKITKKSILKYSNTAVFERRERNFNSEENAKQNIKKMFHKTCNFFRKKNNKKKEDILQSFHKTMTSFISSEKSKNILPLLEYFEKNIKTKKKTKFKVENNLVCKTERNFREKDLFKAEISSLTTKNKRKINKYYFKNNNSKKANTNNNITKDKDINVLLLIQNSRNQKEISDNNNIFLTNPKLNIESYLSKDKPYERNYSYAYAQTEQNKNFWDKTSEEYANYVYEIKRSKYDNNLSFKDYINKLHEQKINNHISKAKTERLKRLDEAYHSQVEFYMDCIKSFMTSKKYLENEFSNKVGDYARFISSKREIEKMKQSSFRQKIMDFRKEIELIRAKINKIEIEKKNIIKWIFLQIQMKEKKLNLPEYYKNIITNYGTNKSSERLFFKPDEKTDSFERKKNNSKNAIIRPKDYFAIKYFKKDSINSNDKKDKIIEYKRIMDYKNNLIYKTPEEFYDRLISLEKGNLVLLQYKDILHSQLFKYKKELESLKKERFKFENEHHKIRSWENELKIIKKLADENDKKVSILKKKKMKSLKNNLDKNIEKDEHSKSNSNINRNIIDNYKYKNISLYKSIYLIFEKCQMIGNNLKFAPEILNQVSRKINTKEKEMLLMLEFIEQTVDYLIVSINKEMNKNNETKIFVKKFRLNIEKQHKIDKAKIQMMLDIKKSKFLAERVNKRYNKIYFLPKRKSDLNGYKFKNEEKTSRREINKKHNIQDYLYSEESSKE